MGDEGLIPTLEEIASYLDAKGVTGNQTWREWGRAVTTAAAQLSADPVTVATFGPWVREERQRQNLSQEAIMRISGYGHANLSQVERAVNHKGPTLDTMVRILNVLGYELRIVRKSES